MPAPTLRERVIAAVTSTIAATGLPTQRNTALPTALPASGLLIVRDGNGREIEVTLSPLIVTIEHTVLVEVFSPAGEGGLDDLLAAMASTLTADRTLGGLTVWLSIEPPDTLEAYAQGASPVYAAVVPVIVTYDVPGHVLA